MEMETFLPINCHVGRAVLNLDIPAKCLSVSKWGRCGSSCILKFIVRSFTGEEYFVCVCVCDS